MARVLVAGARGNMGRRYAAIVRWLCHKPVEVDIGDAVPKAHEIDAAIIATPTDTHIDMCTWCCHNGIPFLCEKPVAKSVSEVSRIADYSRSVGVSGYVVNNWCYVHNDEATYRFGGHTVKYDCWNTGRDGTAWDCIQLYALAKDKQSLSIKTENPTFIASLDGKRVTLDDIAQSYVWMVGDFLGQRGGLWSLQEAVEATKRVTEWGLS